MAIPLTPELALKVIEANKRTKNPNLDLGRCGLTHFPREAEECVWVEMLVLSDEYYDYGSEDDVSSKNQGGPNVITSLEGIEKLKLLKKLVVGGYDHYPEPNIIPLDDLSPIAELTLMEELYCPGTELSDLAPLSKLSSLRVLQCGSTKVTDLSPIAELSSLRELYCYSTPVSDLRPISGLTGLTIIVCSTTEVRDLTPVAKLSALCDLLIASTKVSSLLPLSGLASLKKLNCSSTRVSDLSPLSGLSTLKELACSSTDVSDLSPLSGLLKLERLDCSSTFVSDLSPLLPFLKRGITFYLESYINFKKAFAFEDCPLVHPPIEVVEKGTEAILDYFDRLEKEGEQELLEAKTLLIGEGMSGKTSLRNRLFGRPLPKQPDRTKGLDVEIEPYTFPLAGDKAMRLNIFDFGGQDHYKPLHQFFYSRRSLYLLLTKNGDDQNDFDFWLETAKLHGDDSPLLVVNNLFGDVKCNFNQAKWAKDYPFVKDSFEVNLKSETGLDNLKRQIEAYAQTLPHIRQVVPRSWAAIRAAVEERTKNESFIGLTDYLSICQENGIEERQSALRLSQYLHDIGVFLHFQNTPALRRWVILRNKWATDAVYRVLDDGEVIRNKGHFTEKDYNRIWSTGEYIDMQDALLDLMKEFRLCYAKPGGRGFIAPYLLPNEPATYEWPADPDERRIRLEYKFMPRVLFTQFIVSEHEKIEDGRLRVWRTGAVFSKGATRAEARQLGKNAIELRAQGERMVELLTILNDSLDELHELTPGIEVERLIPCICSRCRNHEEPYLFAKSRLDNRLRHGRLKDECQISFEELLIEELLGNVLFVKKERLQRKINPAQERRVGKKVFISYSHSNTKWMKRLNVHLAALRRSNVIDVWDDQQILAGGQWDDTIQQNLADADVFILLLSADFIASDYIWDVELKAAIEGFDKKNKQVIPILVEPFDLGALPGINEHKTKIQSFEILPKDMDEKLLAVSKWKNQEEALTKVAERIREAVKGQ